MKRYTLPFILLLGLLCGCTSSDERVRTIEDFNFDWLFQLGDSETYAAADCDDSGWRQLRLPHDWAIEGAFSADNPSTPSGGALPGGIGWYRKHFTAPAGERITLEFDGVFMNSTVWVNGQEVGYRPYGYSSFSYDITPYLHPGENVVAVKCDNSLQPNSRWYAGCGIYRNVRLVATDPLHVAYSGTCVTTPEITDKEAAVAVGTRIEGPASSRFKVRQRIFDPRGRKVAERTDAYEIPEGADAVEAEQTLRIADPQLWSPAGPALYSLRTEILRDGSPVDDYETVFGIRSFEFDVDRGLFLNGEPLKLKGVCLHHDQGALGAAVHRRAIERQLEILREMGCNAIRTSHNPPAPELLDLCDRMGFVVMDEALDMWRKRKTTYDYSLYFDEWHQRDVEDFIRRDRNHPSVLIWSVGNEILEQWNSDDDSGALDAEQANLLMNFRKNLPQSVSGETNPNILLTHHMAELVRNLDRTRPVMAGCNEPRPHNNLLRSGAFDIIGYNYANDCYDSVRIWFPGKPFLGSETTSSIMSRGFYEHPSSKPIVQPAYWWKPYETPHHQCTSYDNCRVPWGVTHEKAWIDIRDREYAAGIFIWTGFDYLGEPTPYSWPSRSSYFGIVDLAGFPKDVYYMYRSEWSDRTTLHLFPHWNWTEGDKIDLWAYYNNADEVELFVNGRSLGRQSKTPEQLHCIWPSVAFEPGEITAVSYKEGQEVSRCTRRTAGAVAGLRLTADRDALAADGYDLAYVTVDAVDSEGNFVPTAMDDLHFTVEGAAELVGVDNGDASGMQCLKGDRMRLFNGKALAIVRTLRNRPGTATLTVTSDSGVKAELQLTALD